MSYNQHYHIMRDGTIKQTNPFTGTEVWCPPGRASRPLPNSSHKVTKKLKKKISIKEEDYCSFCYRKMLKTPPEKSRIIEKQSKKYEQKHHLQVKELFDTIPLFRRVSNLFEIVTFDYWHENYNYELSGDLKEWKYSYLSSKEGKEHCISVINYKLHIQDVEPDSISDNEKLDKLSNAFFGGCHELIIAGQHFSPNAEYDNDLCSSGCLTPEKHYQYIRFTIDSILAIHFKNRFARYVSVFQNWRAPAGASFDHLHKQLVALDEWGTSINKELELVRSNRNIYNEYLINFAIYYELVIAENDHAIAIAEYGHRFPSVGIYSKSAASSLFEHTEEEIRGISDLMQAIHHATGNHVAANEEWFYAPLDSIDPMPFHVLIKWRIINQAGFEGGTKIY
ncbi:MAG: DUF4921 family protein, partial [Verrucomicrobiota bacterium]|nr:DUF4921 family protein [Verrucomicrobiota bacterium]